MDDDELEEIIRHFTHGHPLELIQISDGPYECYCCGFSYNATDIYACREGQCRDYKRLWLYSFNVGTYLCVLCARLEESAEIHALHPLHPRLKLVRDQWLCSDNGIIRNTNPKCDACCCNIQNQNFRYVCEVEKCEFQLHIRCAHSLPPWLALPRDSPHSHLLTLISSNDSYSFMNCESCHSAIPRYAPFARCVPCNLNYHIYCNNPDYRVPDCIMYLQGHHQHPLFLSPDKMYSYSTCHVCCKKRDWPVEYVYACLERKSFTAHISCVFQSFTCLSSNSVCKVVADTRLQSGPLHEAAQCQRCKNRILDEFPVVYGCQHCNFFLHESCISPWLQEPMVEEKTIISHLNYTSLVLVFAHGKVFKCASCERPCSGFMFQDKTREEFVVDIECIFLLPSLELIGHDHLVTLLQNRDTKRFYLRCIQCFQNFYFRPPYCRLPRTILHECHFHPLTLVALLFEYNSIDQCYCDVCEEKRDPNECLYYCEECKFEVHIGCVKSEVLGPSRSKLKDVEFVTLEEIKNIEKMDKKKIKVRDVFSLKDVLQHSYTEVHKEFDIILHIAREMTWENSVGENLSHNNDVLNQILYSSEPFKNFIKELTSFPSIENTHSTLESLRNEEVVRVREYLVPLNSEEVVEALLDKYGDFGASYTCSREAKQYLFVGLYKALQSMCETKIARVTESLLMEWWAWFAMGKTVGFKIEFALESLKRIVLAHFGLEADKYAIDKLRTVRNKIRKLPEEIKELRKEWEELGRKLAEKTEILKEAEIEEKELRELAFRVKKSTLMKECLKEAQDLVCYTAGETFLPPSE